MKRIAVRSIAALVLAAVLVAPTTLGNSPTSAAAATAESAPGAPVLPISHHGRWLTDATGRVLLIHGVNFVAKEPGQTPESMGFSDDDAQWIVDNGFDVVRLGTTAASIMPTPGVIDTSYVDSFARTAKMLTDHGLLVLVDLHQDGWGPTLGSDGFPDWMTLTGDAENTGTEFPLYYITNPAIQAAFDSFWNNTNGPAGTLQDNTAEIWKALAGAVADDPEIIGYDLLNEPWPGTVWSDCITAAGCPVQDRALDDYHTRMTAAVRSKDPTHLIFGEPYVLFNFGTGPTHIQRPGNDPASGMSWHMYTTDPALEPNVIAFAEQWSAQTGGALLNTEFGAVWDPDVIDRMTGELDSAFHPWIWWAYNEEILQNSHVPPTDENLEPAETVNAIVRPHPSAVAGTPVSSNYDPAAKTFTFAYSTDRVGGGAFAAKTATSFQLTERTYPNGYQVDVNGGHIVSEPGAQHLLVEADPGADCVAVAVAPTGAAAPQAPADACTTKSPSQPSKPKPVASAAVAVRHQPTFTG